MLSRKVLHDNGRNDKQASRNEVTISPPSSESEHDSFEVKTAESEEDGFSYEGCGMRHKLKKICCIGAGYVGGPTMAVIALKCPDIQVFVVDLDESKIAQWNSDKLPIFEPELYDIILQCRGINLFFSTDVGQQIAQADLIYIAVDTPTKRTGLGKGRAADLKNLELVARTIAKYSHHDKIVVEKSTVPVRAAESIKSILSANKSNNSIHFEVLSNPEFMAEGSAIENLLSPDRILVGGDFKTKSGRNAIKLLKDLYSRWIDESKVITTNTWSSELAKLASNAFLAQRLSSINAMATICESTGADIDEVSRAIGMDSRIGANYLQASFGFGGSCFQKDVLNLVYLSECLQLPEVADYWHKVIEMNDYQRTRAAHRIVKCLHSTVDNKRLAIFGFAFKANTGDTRESSAKYICLQLLEESAKLRVYDPKVPHDKIRQDLNVCNRRSKQVDKDHNHNNLADSVEVFDDPYECTQECHAIIICTDWSEFAHYDYSRIYQSMVKPAYIFDGRRLLNADSMRKIGFNVESIGSGGQPREFHWI